MIIDVRGTAFGDVDAGLAAARLFVKSGVLVYRQDRGKEKEAVSAVAGDGAITITTVILTDNGTSNGAEVFAAALAGNKRAQLIGERTLGRAARQKLVRLPDGSGLMLTHLIYLTPASVAIHEKGLVPDVAVEQPDLDFGQPPAAKDATLDKAIESLTVKGRCVGRRRHRQHRMNRQQLIATHRQGHRRQQVASHRKWWRRRSRPSRSRSRKVMPSPSSASAPSRPPSARPARGATRLTGGAIKIPRRKTVRFSAGKALKTALN